MAISALPLTRHPHVGEEIVTAVKTLKDGKASCYDGISPECFKADPETCSRLLEGIFIRARVDEVKLSKKSDWITAVMKIFNDIIL